MSFLEDARKKKEVEPIAYSPEALEVIERSSPIVMMKLAEIPKGQSVKEHFPVILEATITELCDEMDVSDAIRAELQETITKVHEFEKTYEMSEEAIELPSINITEIKEKAFNFFTNLREKANTGVTAVKTLSVLDDDFDIDAIIELGEYCKENRETIEKAKAVGKETGLTESIKFGEDMIGTVTGSVPVVVGKRAVKQGGRALSRKLGEFLENDQEEE